MTEQELQRARANAQINNIRMQPIRQLPMTLLMMWMVGNDVSIFSIIFVGMAVVNPLQAIAGVNKEFVAFEEDAEKDAQVASAVKLGKLVYIACCLAAFFVALIKLNWMELLPVLSMDWMSGVPPPYKEHVTGVFFNEVLIVHS
ncbi:hypothetical protein STCU_01216 [Strigomonas culicis]|uniref:ER membrane protein complex subunit 4 n=1 Tax=Strigomonas culicis TaxID=28005 RepID=S9V2H9_9TRYP|nr:hypothetical protein STCU_01216 [Strigomonas culicis]|eukprot:EPY35168.1 hypothetical protein STCU_01216 [Strigomonas culicis]